MLKFNGGRGAIICDKCSYMIVSDCSTMKREDWLKQKQEETVLWKVHSEKNDQKGIVSRGSKEEYMDDVRVLSTVHGIR